MSYKFEVQSFKVILIERKKVSISLDVELNMYESKIE
jgi:hypothetical protein